MSATMPLAVMVALTHAEIQVLAADAGIELLHIKGPALDASLLRPWPEATSAGRGLSLDADVLIRPSQVAALAAALRGHGWTCRYDFADGSAFEHAATWTTPGLSSLDVHRYFPGIEGEPEQVFDTLWSARQQTPIAGVSCAVPSLSAQRLIVLVHAARGRSPRDIADRGRAWESLGEGDRRELDHLAARLGASVALYAGTGRLDLARGARTFSLWQHLTTGDGSRLTLWWVRVKAAPTLPAAARVGARMLLPNRARIQAGLGRPPTQSEVLSAYHARIVLGIGQLRRGTRRRWRRALRGRE